MRLLPTALLLIAGLAFAANAFGASGDTSPRPCMSPAWPAAATVGTSPSVAAWRSDQFPRDWELPACAGWEVGRFELFAAVAGTLQATEVDAIAERIGAISTYKGMRYWSVTDRRFDVLITDAFAVDGPHRGSRRADFTSAEMQVGRDLFFIEQDNRSSTPMLYRMRIVERDAEHLVLDLENVDRVSKMLLTLFEPGDLRTTLFVSRSHGGEWRCYALSGSHPRALAGLRASEKSQTNRLIAFYAHSMSMEDTGMPWER